MYSGFQINRCATKANLPLQKVQRSPRRNANGLGAIATANTARCPIIRRKSSLLARYGNLLSEKRHELNAFVVASQSIHGVFVPGEDSQENNNIRIETVFGPPRGLGGLCVFRPCLPGERNTLDQKA